jgi:hypothetical protein
MKNIRLLIISIGLAIGLTALAQTTIDKTANQNTDKTPALIGAKPAATTTSSIDMPVMIFENDVALPDGRLANALLFRKDITADPLKAINNQIHVDKGMYTPLPADESTVFLTKNQKAVQEQLAKFGDQAKNYTAMAIARTATKLAQTAAEKTQTSTAAAPATGTSG